MKYWKVELKYDVETVSMIDRVYVTEVEVENELFSSEVMRFPDGSEQLFRSAKSSILSDTTLLRNPLHYN